MGYILMYIGVITHLLSIYLLPTEVIRVHVEKLQVRSSKNHAVVWRKIAGTDLSVGRDHDHLEPL